MDLTLDPVLSEYRRAAMKRYFDPGEHGYAIDQVLAVETVRVVIDEGKRYEFEPGKLILAWTTEKLDLRKSPRLAARVEGKSSLGRLSLGVHVTAPTIHAGFVRRFRLEMVNHGHVLGANGNAGLLN
jgi:dCTP deaminase